MTFEFPKDDYLAATRHLLADVANWMQCLFDVDASERLFGIDPEIFRARPEAWEESGSAGREIEDSTVLRHMRLVLDCLNNNSWNGDADSLRWVVKELRPLYALITSKPGLMDPEEEYWDLGTAATLYCQVFEVIDARVSLDGNYDLTVPKLARIAGLAEKTVRMAAIGRNRNPDLATEKHGNRIHVDADEARRWLASKGIEYQPIQYISKGALPVASPSTSYELASCLSDLRNERFLAVANLIEQLGWSEMQESAYAALESGTLDTDAQLLSLDEIMNLARTLCPDESAELVRRIDAITHPIALQQQLERRELFNKQSEHTNDD